MAAWRNHMRSLGARASRTTQHSVSESRAFHASSSSTLPTSSRPFLINHKYHAGATSTGANDIQGTMRSTAGIVAMGLSIASAIGALLLVEDSPNVKKFEYLQDSDHQITPRHSSSGSAGRALEIGAFSVGEQITTQELLRRYEFHTPTPTLPRTAAGEASKDEKKKKKRKQMQVIGKGAYGRVVRATERATGRHVAMKIVPRAAMSAEALLREVEVLRRVRGHDNVIHLRDTFGCGGEWYVVTELCEGGELLDKLITKGPYDEDHAALLAERCASALVHIHRSGYVHLDLKPENLVFAGHRMDEDGSTDCRIIDFGMAKEISKVKGKLSMLALDDSGRRLGTMAYWAPEQLASVLGKGGRGLKPTDPNVVTSDPRACDAWALGNLIYIMLLGCHPFDPKGTGNETAIARAVLKGKYSFDVHGDKLRISPQAQDLIAHLLDPDPRSRYTPEKVLEHAWVRSRCHKNPDEEQRLPYSWAESGYATKGEADRLIELTNECQAGVNASAIAQGELNEDVIRLMPYLKHSVTDALIEAVLITAVAHGERQLALPGTKIWETPQSLAVSKIVPPNATGGTASPSNKAKGWGPSGWYAWWYNTDKPTNGNNQISPDSVAHPQQKQQDQPTTTAKVGLERRFLQESFAIIAGGQRPLIKLKDIFELSRSIERGASDVDSDDGDDSDHHGNNYRRHSIAKRPVAGAGDGNGGGGDAGISFEEFVALLRFHNCVSRRFEAGETIFSQGAEPQGIYILLSGKASLEYRNDHTSNNSDNTSKSKTPGKTKRNPTLIASDTTSNTTPTSNTNTNSSSADATCGYFTLEEGSMIGETALLQGRKHRAATVRCIEPSQVLFIHKDDFLGAMARSPALHAALFSVVRAQQARRIYDLVESLNPPSLRKESFNTGDVIFHQSDPVKDMYLIRKGTVGVSISTPASAAKGAHEMGVLVAERGPGDITGMSAVLDAHRSTSATCLTPVETVAIDHEDLKDLLATNALFRFYVEAQQQLRKEAWQQTIADVERGVTEPQLLAMLKDQGSEGYEVYNDVVKHMTAHKFEAGETIISKGQVPEKFFLIESGVAVVEFVQDSHLVGDKEEEDEDEDGKVEETKGNKTNKENEGAKKEDSEEDEAEDGKKPKKRQQVLQVAQLAAGDHFGEQALLEDRDQYYSNIRCVTPVELMALDKETFLRYMGENEDTLFAKAVSGAMRQRQHRWVRNLLSLAKAQEKLAKESKKVTTEGVGQKGADKNGKSVKRMVSSRGDILFTQGDPADALYYVHRGKIQLLISDADGQGYTLKRSLGPGDTIGLDCFCDGAHQKFTAVVETPRAVLSKIPRATLDMLVRENEYVSESLQQHMERTTPKTELEHKTRGHLSRHVSIRYENKE